MTEPTYTPTRPYMIRAIHDWFEDNDLTAHILVDATHSELVAPTEYAQEGILALSISYRATGNLTIGNDGISFSARFNGVSQDLWIPIDSVLALRAKEDPSVLFPFNPNEYQNHKPTPKPNADKPKDDVNKPKAKKKTPPSHLKITK